MKVATCTPVDFVADEHFFGRDSGLLCRGFQDAGVKCVSIMPGVATDRDAPDLVRTKYENLSEPSWWQGLGVDLVILYAWGDPRYLPIANAIRSAGVLLVQNLDTAGLCSPYSHWKDWMRRVLGMMAIPQSLFSRVRHVGKAMRDLMPSLYEQKRLGMIAQSDFVAVVSPPAMNAVRHYAESLGWPDVAAKVILIPHPVIPFMRYQGEPKGNLILAVGRWEPADAGQKDPERLLAVLQIFLDDHPDWQAEVIGRGSGELERYCKNWKPETGKRLILTPAMNRRELARKYCMSRILICPSRHESFHISSGEAVCCGCSVVVADHPLLASTSWFTRDQSGKLSKGRSVDQFRQTLNAEVEAWSTGKREPFKIAHTWGPRLHAPQIAGSLLNHLVMRATDHRLSKSGTQA